MYLDEGACECHENANRARFLLSQHDRTQRDLLPSAEVLVCERTIQNRQILKYEKL